MYTSLILFALSCTVNPNAPSDARSPQWLRDYSTAWHQGTREKKPMALFFGVGESGWEKLSKEGKLGKEVSEVLADHYVCLYIDTSSEAGKKLALTFEVPHGVGIVIGDRSGEKQAFHHQGDLKNEDLEYYLRKYANPNVVIRTTETNPPERGSVPRYSGYFQPAGGSVGRSC